MSNANVEDHLLRVGISELPKLFKSLWEIGKEFVGERDFLNYSKRYKEGLEEDYSYMQILGMERPIPLDDIYTEVRFISRLKSRMYKSIEELEQETRHEIEKRSLSDIEEKVRAELENQIRTMAFKRSQVTTEKSYQPLFENIAKQEQQAIEELKLQYEQDIQSGRWKNEDLELEKWRKAETHRITNDYLAVKSVPFQSPEEIQEIEKKYKEELEAIENQTSSKKRQRYENPLGAIKNHYRERKRNLEKKKKNEIEQARINSTSRDLTPDELYEIKSRFSAEVEKELDKETRRELNDIILSDFGVITKQDTVPMPVWDALSGKDRVVILGKPGAGKTTFLKQTLLRHLRGIATPTKFPIFITLKEFIDSQHQDILDFIAESFDACGFRNARAFLDRLLRSKQTCLLLFDGLDEFPRNMQQEAVRQIVKLSKKYRQNQFIVSCRTASYHGELEGFTEVEVSDFGLDQVAKFAKGWFQNDSHTIIGFLKEVKRHPGLRELTATPLLLALLCITFKRNQRFPDQKSILYLACVDALFVDWDSSRQVQRESFVDRFDVESKKQLLGKVACDTFCLEEQFFSKSEIIDKFNINSRVLPIEPNRGANILEEFEKNHGLLVERAKDIFSFSHLTFHEFFTAFHLSRNQRTEVLENLCKEIRKEARWKEVAVFLGGLLARADIFLVCLRNHMKAILAESKLSGSLLQEKLPEPARVYIDETSKNEEISAGWTAWFRCRLIEYKLHQASYGAEYSSFQFSLQPLANLIVQISLLGKDLKHDLSHDRPLNFALKKSLTDIHVSKHESILFQNNIKAINDYFRIAIILLEILFSRARVTPNLKIKILEDIFQPSVDVWDYPVPIEQNKLGV